MKLRKLFTKDGFRRYLRNIVVDIKCNLRDNRNAFRKHSTYHDVFTAVIALSLLIFLATRNMFWVRVSFVSLFILFVNYFIKIYRFGTKEYKWYD